MDDSPKEKLTLRQAIAGQWQIPLFVIALASFVVVLWNLRPVEPPVTYQQKLEQLQLLANQNDYPQFFTQAEIVRFDAQDEAELGQLYGLVANTRVRQLNQLHKLDLDTDTSKAAKENYELLINDYNQAINRNWSYAQQIPGQVEIYRNMGQAYWCLNDSDRAIQCYDKAIEVNPDFNPPLHRDMVKMYQAARPKGYLDAVGNHLEQLLAGDKSSDDDKAWAFVRKAEWLIAKGQENQMLEMLEKADDEFLKSKYGEELELLRARGLSKAGQLDKAELILRDLIDKTADRGDLYAQIALELGKINYLQFRDYDARVFYEKVVGSQAGKDWFVAGKLGLAECDALTQHYDQAAELYQEVVDLIKKNPRNRAIDLPQVQNSLAVLADNLSLFKQYELALKFLEIEQQIAPPDDIRSAYNFAQTNAYRANQLYQQLKQPRPTDQESQVKTDKSEEQQRRMIAELFELAAVNYLKVVQLAVHDDNLYGDCLWQAATCYDKAGNTEKTIQTWMRFVDERQGQSQWPMGAFYLAQAYQATGKYEQAINVFRKLLLMHPNSPAAFNAMVPLAKCHLAKDPPEPDQAEGILNSILVDQALTPMAPSYRQAMFVLGDLYYRNQKYDKAINILTEAIDRYPNDSQLGKSMFLVADSYRKSGLAINAVLEKLADDPTATLSREKNDEQRRKYLENAKEYFDLALNVFSKIPENKRSSLENVYLRHCYLYRADCLFDLARYREAIQLYETAVMRYQLTPTALGAFMQIVNCQLKLGNLAEARFTNERAVWQLRKMPDAALAAVPGSLTRNQWDLWFQWLSQAGMW